MLAYNCHGKIKNLTAKTKYLTAKPNTSRQNQNSFGFAWVFAFTVRYLVFAVKYWFCREVFGFAVRVLVLPWGILLLIAVRSLVLPWGFCFCCEVFYFSREVVVYPVRFLFLSWGILFLPWGFRFCREVFSFAVRFLVLPWQLWATVWNCQAEHMLLVSRWNIAKISLCYPGICIKFI